MNVAATNIILPQHYFHSLNMEFIIIPAAHSIRVIKLMYSHHFRFIHLFFFLLSLTLSCWTWCCGKNRSGWCEKLKLVWFRLTKSKAIIIFFLSVLWTFFLLTVNFYDSFYCIFFHGLYVLDASSLWETHWKHQANNS